MSFPSCMKSLADFVVAFPSVVFTSAYRITVFVHDISPDMTYTLAPDAGWVVIEQAAAVSSASFPTLGPALLESIHQFRRLLGLSTRPRHRQTAAMEHEEVVNPNRARFSSPEEENGELFDLADFMKAQNGSSSSHARPATDETEKYRGKALSLTMTRSQDGASDETPLNSVRVRRSVILASVQTP